MNTNRMMQEIWSRDIHWTLGKDIKRGVFMHTATEQLTLYAETAEDVIRKVWLYLYKGEK